MNKVYEFDKARKITDLEECGSGSSFTSYKCIVLVNSTEKQGILKVFAPKGFETDFLSEDTLERLYIPSEKSSNSSFEEEFKKFDESQKEIINLLNTIEQIDKALRKYYDSFGINDLNNNYKFSIDTKNHKYYGLVLYEFVENDLSKCYKTLSIYERLNVVLLLSNSIKRFHENGLIICDLKPSNIVYDNCDDSIPMLQIIDLDSIKKVDKKTGKIAERLAPHSKTGSSFFSAPEVVNPIEHRRISTKSDIYSLGAMLLYFVTENEDFVNCCSARSDSRISRNKLHELLNEASLEGIRDEYPAECKNLTTGFWNRFASIVLKATDSIKNRYDSVGEFINELKILIEIYNHKGIHPEVMLDSIFALRNAGAYETDGFKEELLPELEIEE